MNRRAGVFTVLAVLFVLLGTFQNCAVHQSDARKRLDVAGLSSHLDDACLPFLTNEGAIAAMTRTPSGEVPRVSTKLIEDGTGSRMSCLITLGDGQASPLDVVNCRVSEGERQYLDKVIRGTADQSAPIRATKDWSFQSEDRSVNDALNLNTANAVGFWEVLNNGTSTVFAAVGGTRSGTLAVRCYSTFSTAAGSQLTSALRTAALQQSVRLINEFAVSLDGY